jgi:lysozyme
LAGTAWLAASLALLGCGAIANGVAGGVTGGGSTTGPGQAISGTPVPVPTPAPRPSSAANISACATGSTVPGIDVSDYDPGTQWLTTKRAGIGFAFIKATEGTTLANANFAGDWAGTQANGIYRGAYHFFHPSDDPAQQAQFFLQAMGALAATDLPALLDWEVTDGVSNATQAQNALTWLQLVERSTKKIPIIYTGPAFWNALGNPTAFARYPLFIAHYGVACPSIPAPWSSWAFWQTGEGTVAGLQSSQADQDAFNGTASQLANFAQTGVIK